MLDEATIGRVLTAVSDVSPYGMCVIDADAVVVHANPAMGQLLGTADEDLPGAVLTSWLRPADRADEQPVDGALAAGSTREDGRRLRRRVVRSDGRERVVTLLLWDVPADVAGRELFVVQVLPDAEDAWSVGPAPASRVPLRVVQARAVEEAATALAGAVTVADVTAVMERQLQAFDAQGLLISLADGPRLRLASSRGYPDPVRKVLEDQPMAERSPMVEAVLERSPIFVETFEDYVARYPQRQAVARAAGKGAWAFLPMIAGGEVIGSWCLSFDGPHRFTVSERALLTTLSGLLAQAVARSEVLAAERSLTRTLQRSLLPQHLPDVPGCAIAVRYQTAVAGLEVGGDFYDVIPLPKGGTGIVIGDAQGHSAAAAALMGQVRGALRAYAAEGHDPATIVARANRFLLTAGADSFVTCTYAALDATHDGLTIVRAGHPQPLLVMPDGTAGSLDVPGGLPLGIDPQASYPVTWVPLTEGCRVVLYTDGLVERRDLDLGRGEAALLARARSAVREPLPAFADALIGHDPAREDDVALLILERTGANGGPGVRQATFEAATTDAAAVRAMRRAVTDRVRDWGWHERADEVELLVSELITNAVVHVGGSVVVTVTGSDAELTVAVSDTSVHTPQPRTDDLTGEDSVWRTSGRGLAIVSAVADSWGIDPSGPGKSVWFSLSA
ncbi:SpoIIE family protein phosphatase [Kineosporiaceae bacterium SCSIO 59966]|nr:SpoIIE family protein phosphatase [Kineosporiaceae bacterium SCSIO 59966]